MRRFFQTWLVTMMGVLVACYVVNGIRADTLQTLFVTSFVLGFLNAFIRPVLMILAFPLMILTLGLFTFILNGLLFYFTSWLVKGFYVESFFAAFNGGLVISVMSLLASIFLPKNPTTRKSQAVQTPRAAADSQGPVIDV
ncbi:MAG: phage holin family protein [Verrucomicrobia bacterium]|nr:MAG: phage holin family protein [Verrucomicrobiota bacterium]